ncbi:MAG: hypothetical protein OEZ43_09580 [Gammaproteobacteria bacterium]|nr:hypothetical protein [Gammaproteobacteria bacterium]
MLDLRQELEQGPAQVQERQEQEQEQERGPAQALVPVQVPVQDPDPRRQWRGPVLVQGLAPVQELVRALEQDHHLQLALALVLALAPEQVQELQLCHHLWGLVQVREQVLGRESAQDQLQALVLFPVLVRHPLLL